MISRPLFRIGGPLYRASSSRSSRQLHITVRPISATVSRSSIPCFLSHSQCASRCHNQRRSIYTPPSELDEDDPAPNFQTAHFLKLFAVALVGTAIGTQLAVHGAWAVGEEGLNLFTYVPEDDDEETDDEGSEAGDDTDKDGPAKTSNVDVDEERLWDLRDSTVKIRFLSQDADVHDLNAELERLTSLQTRIQNLESIPANSHISIGDIERQQLRVWKWFLDAQTNVLIDAKKVMEDGLEKKKFVGDTKDDVDSNNKSRTWWPWITRQT